MFLIRNLRIHRRDRDQPEKPDFNRKSGYYKIHSKEPSKILVFFRNKGPVPSRVPEYFDYFQGYIKLRCNI